MSFRATRNIDNFTMARCDVGLIRNSGGEGSQRFSIDVCSRRARNGRCHVVPDFARHVYESALAQAAEPCALTFCEAARADFDSLDHRIATELTGEKSERFAISHGLPRRAAQLSAAGCQTAYFFH